jgi:hypothetical protein
LSEAGEAPGIEDWERVWKRVWKPKLITLRRVKRVRRTMRGSGFEHACFKECAGRLRNWLECVFSATVVKWISLGPPKA